MRPSRVLAAIGVGAALLLAGAPGPKAPGMSGRAAPAGRFLVPVDGAVVTQPYGCTSLGIEPLASWCPGGHFHTGVDLAAPYGTAVKAAAAGTLRIGIDAGGYGRFLTVDHGGGLTTLYGHLSSTTLAPGSAVAPGQEIGRVGSSGLSTGPHLHFEVRRNGRPVDPSTYLGIGGPAPAGAIGRQEGSREMRDGQQGHPDRASLRRS